MRAAMASLRSTTVLCALLPLAALADDVQRGDPVVVTATRTTRAPFDVPASVDRVDGDDVRAGRLGVNLSESLAIVPGLAIQNRNNYAQDLQLSIRGFGARSTFGIRGVRMYVDDIPATQPDGQGQLTHVDLASVDRIEVLRGPFSALYGNSSGGVVNAYTESPSAAARLVPSFAAGGLSTLRIGLKASGPWASAADEGYVLSASHFETDGPRPHSAARRDVANAKLVARIGPATTATVIANRAELPRAEDPLGLTRAQFDRDPRSVDAAALQFDTRKSFTQSQAGVAIDHRVSDATALHAIVYGGERSTRQFQAIPVATQAPATSPGGVIDLSRRYAGFDARATTRVDGVSVVAGLAVDRLLEHRRGYQNFSGPTLGVLGALRRDEDNIVQNVDPYLQLSWTPVERLTLDAGVRRSRVRFASDDRYVVAGNPDDSGRVRYQATSPAVGALWRALPALNLYATAGRGFETPTGNELAYRADGSTGLNLALQPSRSTSVETGAKLRTRVGADALVLANAALFTTRVDDELVTLTNVGGRSTFTNAGRTRRRGGELSLAWTWRGDFRAQAAATLIDARYRDGFATCRTAPCAVPNVAVPAGNRIPGIARTQGALELAWSPPAGPRAGVELRGSGRVVVDDAGSDAAPGYAVANARVGYLWRGNGWTAEAFARVDNLASRRYAGSVIVNEGNGRYFEPAQRRVALVGATATLGLDR